jgi:hypothetical protein
MYCENRFMRNVGATTVIGLMLVSSIPVVAQSISLLNGDFELDTPAMSPPSGWTANTGTMYVTTGVGYAGDPSSAFYGDQFVTANRLAPNPDASFPDAQSMGIFQIVDVSAHAGEIDLGNRFAELTFAYSDGDAGDAGRISMQFLDAASSPLGNALFDTSSMPTQGATWATSSLVGTIPAGTRSIEFSLLAERVGSGTARNVCFDSLAAQIVDELPPAPARDVVHANLIQFVDNGAWSWFQDERAIVDTEKGKLIVGSMANRDGVGGEARDGHVQTTHFDLATGSRTQYVHNDLESYGAGDDHNVPGLLKKTDGNILAFYAAHNRLGSTEDDRSYYRTYDVETETWNAETEYHWWDVIPDNAPGSGGTTYSNVFQLSAEDPDQDGNGRLYNIARTQQSPHIMYSDDNGVTWEYGGQLTKQASNPPATSYVNGYYKYNSNGVDRIDFIATEFHPADYNNSVYHAYIQNGKLYDSSGIEIDNDIFDAAASFDPSKVTSTDDFTQIFQSGATENSRGWTTDIQRYEDGTLIALFKARAGSFGSSSANSNDHRVWYARFNPNTGHWTSTEIAKAGARLFAGEYDYTGLGAIHPHDPNVLYISTEIDPTTDAALAHHEIYKGVTSDDGATWTWTAVTENSSFDNLRPIIPAWDANNTTVLWWRGSMDTSHDYDTAVVGIIDRKNEQLGLVNYVDATAANTIRADGSVLTLTGPSPNAGANDGSWHQRTGAGNGGNVLSADESGSESLPTLKTSATGMDAGTYDVFAFFWTDVNQDWQIQAGLDEANLMLFRMRGSQQASEDDFAAALVVDEGSRSLYRAYLGRVGLSAGQSIDVFVDDSTGNGTTSVWYDGIGYAGVTSTNQLGDFDGDGDVDGRDFLVWQRGESPIPFSASDLADWQMNYGANNLTSNSRTSPVPEPHSILILISGLSRLLTRHYCVTQWF